jgi:hypothetical protein
MRRDVVPGVNSGIGANRLESWQSLRKGVDRERARVHVRRVGYVASRPAGRLDATLLEHGQELHPPLLALSRLADEAGVPRLPYLKDMPVDLQADRPANDQRLQSDPHPAR